jgi:hypothetical protein
VPVGGEGGVERSQDPQTQTIPSVGPTEHVADEEARAENPMTRIGQAGGPGSAGGHGVGDALLRRATVQTGSQQATGSPVLFEATVYPASEATVYH